MHIVIVGAGHVGFHLAERLSMEGQDVVVVESDPAKAAELQETVDCLVVVGNGSSPAALEQARIGDARLLIAVTSSDAVNVLACQAAERKDVPLKIARVEDPKLREGLEDLGVDVVIDPGETLAEELLTLVRRGGFSEIISFGDDQLVMLGGFVGGEAPVAGISLRELRERVTGWDWLVTAVVRNGDTIVARGDTTIEAGDHVLLMAKADRTAEATELLGLKEHSARKVMILGATRLAQLTAAKCGNARIQTVLIDEEASKCKGLRAKSDRVVLVQGDPTDPKVLRSEGVDGVDVVLALTGWDEVNLMGSLVAKALGASMTVARFHNVELVSLLGGHGVDATVSARMAAANAILRYVRRGRIFSVVTFEDTPAEAIELQVEADSATVGKSLADLSLPRTVIVGGVLRGKEAFVPHGTTVIEADDHLIVFALPEGIGAIEKVFG